METIKTDFCDGNFLSAKELDLVDAWWPTKGWKNAVIYHRHHEQEEYRPDTRQGLKCHENRTEVLHRIREMIMPKMIKWAATKGCIERVWFRYTHVDWLHYREGMFFKEHQDFENYVCQGLVPCVGLLGLSTVLGGGQTRVEGTLMCGSAVRNGFALFQGNVPHEAMRVDAGEKKCLKMEFFVLHKISPALPMRVMVWDKDHRWRSYWGSRELLMVDNFLASLVDFNVSSSKSSNTITLTTDTAQKLHNMMMGISDPRSVRKLLTQKDVDFFFPSFTLPCLHDLFAASSVLHDPNGKIFMGTDALAWEFLNHWKSPDKEYLLIVGLWSRDADHDNYHLDMIGDRYGTIHPIRPCYEDAKVTIASTDSFFPWEMLRSRLIEAFIDSHDRHRSSTPLPEEESKKGYLCKGVCMNPRELNLIKPSDEVLRPNHWAIRRTGRHYEMCNDGEHGQWEEYEVYKSFQMQPRWCMIPHLADRAC